MYGFDLSEALSITKGSGEVAALYLGEQLVWPTTKFQEEYLTITSREDGNNVYLWNYGGYLPLSIQVSKNKTTWTTVTSSGTNGDIDFTYGKGTNIATLNKNEKLYIKGTNTYYADTLSGNNGVPAHCNVLYCLKTYNLSGNVMSLIYGDNFAEATSLPNNTDSNFAGMFGNPRPSSDVYNTTLINARNLILPATSMNPASYACMFCHCTALKTVPKLPATSLANYCYRYMFYDCDTLKVTPRLDATTLAEYCYSMMFAECALLGRIQTFGALYTARWCCYGMFANCQNLIDTKPLMPRILEDHCYESMFYGCTNLDFLETRTTDSNPTRGTSQWLYNVAGEGILRKPSTTTFPINSASGVPVGWTTTNISGYHAVTITTPSHGTVTTDCSSGLEGDIITITATPDTGYVISAMNATSGGQPITITNNQFVMPDDDVTVTVSFVAIQYNIIIDPNITGGTVSAPATATYGSTVTLTISPDTGYSLTSLSVTQNGASVPVNNNQFTMPAGSVNVTASFDIVTYRMSINQTNGMVVSVIKNGTYEISPVSGWYTGLVYGDQIDIEIYPLSGYDYDTFTATSNNTSVPVTVVNTPGYTYRRFTMPTGDVNVNATFSALSNYSSQYLTIEGEGPITIKDATTNTLLYYSVNGAPWESIQPTGTETTFVTLPSYNTCVSRVRIKRTQNYISSTIHKFGGNIKKVFGNLMSFIWGDLYTQATHLNYTYEFYGLFMNCTYLTDASNLIMPNEASDYCYYDMFYGCTQLTDIPSLPATQVYNYSYYQMFHSCTSLRTPPALPATTLGTGCYYNMFYGCTSLQSLPSLPATTLARGCYYGMFMGCTSVQVSSNNYPVLPAETLEQQCYCRMFYQCTNLNRVKIMATDNSASNCTYEWLYGVASTGILYKSNSITLPTNSDSGVPSGWTTSNSFGINVTSGVANGTVTASPSSGWGGETITLTLTPDPGYELPPSYIVRNLSDWSTVTVTNNTFTMPSGDVRVECTFPIEYMTIESEADSNTIYWVVYGSLNNYDIDYSTDKTNWTTITATSNGTPIATLDTGDKIYLRANMAGNTNPSGYNKFRSTGNYKVYGNIVTLASSSAYNSDYLFYSLFYNTNITDASNLVLPEYIMGKGCYGKMFQNCTSLVTAPALPATTLADYCYQYMFNNCTSLTTAPELPATTLASSCYSYMFNSCTGLTSVPELPATTLADSCYQNMFYSCTGLTSVPDDLLPSTTLASSCYRSMFDRCSHLTNAPDLPATTLADNCYRSMFYNCSSLTTAPILPATTLALQCYYAMFNGCTLLATAPALPATTLAGECYREMFKYCSALTTAPALPATTLVGGCYRAMFSNCTALGNAPELPATTLVQYCYYFMFENCTSLSYIKTLATNISASNSHSNFTKGVTYSSGTFEGRSSAGWPNGAYGIPSGWTFVEAS